MPDLRTVLRTVAREYREKIAKKSFEELVLLPPHGGQESITRDGYDLSVTVWHDLLDSGEHRIVVQVGKPGMLASWRFEAAGFVIVSLTEQRSLTDEELSPFR